MSRDDLGGYRLSPQQERLWLLRRGDDSAHFRAECELAIEGDLDRQALRSALLTVVSRHEILRTRFHQLEELELPIQVPDKDVVLCVEEHDLRDLQVSARQRAVQTLIEEFRLRPFDIEKTPGPRFLLITLSSSEHLLEIDLPALCIDSVGLTNLAQEIARAYESPSLLERAEEALQYPDVSEWLNDLLEAEETKAGREYWSKQELPPSCPRLPSENGSPASDGFNPQVLLLEIDCATSRKIYELIGDDADSVSSLLLACWKILLSRLTGNADVLVAPLFDGRNTSQLEATIGVLAKYLPLDVRVQRDSPFLEVVESVRRSKEERAEWQEFFNWKELDQTEYSSNRVALFDYCFEYEEQPESWIANGVVFKVQRQCAYIDRFKINLRCIRNRDSILAEVHYDGGLFAAVDIERLAGEFAVLLQSSLKNPGQSIDDLEILGAAKLRQLLVEFNDTGPDHSTLLPVHELIEDQARRTPGNVAVSFAGDSLTYEQLDSRANKLAHFLLDRGVAVEDRVGLCLERSVEMVVGLLGILKAGCVYVPLDPQSPAERLSQMIEDANAKAMLTQQRVLESFPPFAAATVCLDSEWADIDLYKSEPPAISTDMDNLAYVIYTSGSTGRPKGVMVTHRALANHMTWLISAFGLTAADRVLQKTPFGFDASVWEFYAPLLLGGTLVMAQPGGHRDPDYLFNTIEQESITVLQVVPTLLRAMLGNKQFEQLASLRHVFCGGEVLPLALQEQFFEHLDGDLHNLYGPTETCIDATSWTCRRDEWRSTIPIGRPVLRARTYVCDEKLRPVPIGATGELLIGGICVARGYIHDPALTAERFLPDPFSEEFGARLYRTGDFARYLSDGNLEFLGRKDSQVKLRGLRIDLGEIASELRQHAAVSDAVVSVRQGPVAADQQLVAYVVFQSPTALVDSIEAVYTLPDQPELYRHLEQRLPEYMIPASFVPLDRLPLLSNGKIDRSALPALDPRTESDQCYVEARSRTEQELSRIWREVLGCDRIGVYDNFFDLGGDSILSIQIIARANQVGLQLTPRQLFQHQTIAALAAVSQIGRVIEAEQHEVTGAAPLTPIQEQFFDLQGNQPHFNQSVMLECHREFEPHHVRLVTGALLKHHDALRMRFLEREAGWQQFNLPFHEEMVDQVFKVLDLSGIADWQNRKVALSKAADQVQQSLDLGEGPLMRVVLCDLGKAAGQRLLIVVHHLVIDGVSWRILFEDLQRGMDQLEKGEPIGFGAKTTSFKEWAKKLAAYATGDGLAAESAYWDEHNKEALAGVSVDADAAAEADLVAGDEQVHVELDETDTEALLHEVGKVYGMQINEVLFVGLSVVLSRWTDRDRVVVQLEGHGREQEIVEGVDLTRTVGWFTTLFPVLLDCPATAGGGSSDGKTGGQTWNVQEQVKLVKERMRNVPSQGIGYGLLKWMKREKKEMQRIPIDGQRQNQSSVVSFNYLGQLDGVVKDGGIFGIANEHKGTEYAAAARRDASVEINAVVIGGRLRMSWRFSPRVHRRETIQRAAQWYVEALRELVAESRRLGVLPYTPSDFPAVELTEEKLNEIISVVNFGR